MPARKIDAMDPLPGGLLDGDLIPVYRSGMPWYKFGIGQILRPRDRRKADGTTSAAGTMAVAFSPPFVGVPRIIGAQVLQTTANDIGATSVEVLDLTAAGCTLKAWRAQKITSLLITAGAPPMVPAAGVTIQATFEEDR